MEGQEVLTSDRCAPVLASLVVADEPDGWRAAGFTVDDAVLPGRHATCRIGSVAVTFAGTAAGRGVVSWALAAEDGMPDEIDGVPTSAGPPDARPAGTHPNGAELIDHVVMTTPDPERTIAALEATGAVHRRTRLPDNYDQPMRQDFFRLGEVVLELIGPRQPDPAQAHRPARLYGLAHTVADLDATVRVLGSLVTDAKDAVQLGRRITTLRTRDLGLSVPTAFMSRGGRTTA